MDITNARFPFEAVRIIEEIADSHFVAFDLEFSGVAGRRPTGPSGKHSLQEYYDDIKTAAEKYQILQVGLTVVKEDTKRGSYVVRPYNFNISPLTLFRERQFGRVWSYHSGAISFLMRNGFKFDLPLTQGIQYLSRKEEREVRQTLVDEEEARSKMADMSLKGEDHTIIDHIRKSVKRWQATPKDQQEPFVNIPGEADGVPPQFNRYQVRLTHQIVRNEYPQLKTTGMGHFVQVTNPTDDQVASEKLLQAEARERDIARAVGFRWVVEAVVAGNISAIPQDYLLSWLSSKSTNQETVVQYVDRLQRKLRDRRRVFVGHNCFTDLVNFYKCFFGDLPATIEEFQDEIHSLFPAVVDTKHLASFGSRKWSNTSLEDVEMELRSESVPRIDVPGGYDRYQYASAYHEAGYDSLLTAKAAIKLSAKMHREGKYIEEGKFTQAPRETNEKAFGVGEDEYETAPESPSEQLPKDGGLLDMVKQTLSLPLSAVKSAFGRSETITAHANHNGNRDERSQYAVRAADWSETDPRSKSSDVHAVKNALSQTNIYDTLELDGTGPEIFKEHEAEDEPDHVREQKAIAALVKKGELMPRWDSSHRFWQKFGNRLQVNGSREGICKLL